MFVNKSLKKEKAKWKHLSQEMQKGLWFPFENAFNGRLTCNVSVCSESAEKNSAEKPCKFRMWGKKESEQIKNNLRKKTFFLEKMICSTTTWFEHATFGCLLPYGIEVRRASIAPRGRLYEDWLLWNKRFDILFCAEANWNQHHHTNSVRIRLYHLTLHCVWYCECTSFMQQNQSCYQTDVPFCLQNKRFSENSMIPNIIYQFWNSSIIN